MKGIKRQVRTFAVTNILEGLEIERRVIHYEDEGLYLYLDVDKLKGKALEETRNQLKAALTRLDKESG